MNKAKLVVLSWSAVLMAACSGPESTGIPNAGGRGSYGGGGTAGDFAGTVDTTGTGGDPTAGGGGSDLGDAEASELADVVEAGDDGGPSAVGDGAVADDGGASDVVPRDATAADAGNLDAAVDAPADVIADDVVTTAQCSATPSQDSQCRSPRPHRYVCPLSVGTPTGCQRISTGSTSAAYCCP